MGEGIRSRTSPGLGASTPPLKKKVTCAYFSVSAMRSCFMPREEMYSPSVFFMCFSGKAISMPVNCAS